MFRHIPLKGLVQFKISRALENEVQKLSMEKLSLKSINHLRDKHEGIAFYEKIKRRICSIVAVSNYLNRPLLDLEKAKKSNEFLTQHFVLGNNMACILSSTVSEPFYVPITPYPTIYIFTIIPEGNLVYIAGFLEATKLETLIDSVSFPAIKTLSN